jgi:hypothetical protein
MTEPTVSNVLSHTGHLWDSRRECDSGRSITPKTARRSALLKGAVGLRRVRAGIRDERGATTTRIGSPRSMGDGEEDEGVSWCRGHSR